MANIKVIGIAILLLIAIASAEETIVVKYASPDRIVLIKEGTSIPICYEVKIESNVSWTVEAIGPPFIEYAVSEKSVLFQIGHPNHWEIGDIFNVTLNGKTVYEDEEYIIQLANFTVTVINNDATVPKYTTCPWDLPLLERRVAQPISQPSEPKKPTQIGLEPTKKEVNKVGLFEPGIGNFLIVIGIAGSVISLLYAIVTMIGGSSYHHVPLYKKPPKYVYVSPKVHNDVSVSDKTKAPSKVALKKKSNVVTGWGSQKKANGAWK